MRNLTKIAACVMEVLHDEAANVEAIDTALSKTADVLMQITVDKGAVNEQDLIDDETERWWHRVQDHLQRRRAVATKRAASLALAARSRAVLKVVHDADATMEGIDAALIEARLALAVYDEVAAAISRRLPVVTSSQRESREQEHLRRCIEQDLGALDAGIGDGHLINDPQLEVVRGLQGRRWWQRMEQRLLAQRAGAVERAETTWPREFRYTGQRFRTELDGRYVEPGEVVRLSAHQADSLRDRFEPVETESPAATV